MLKVDSLDAGYGDAAVLQGVSVAVAAGEVTAAFGPLHEREELHALRGQPRALLSGGEVDVRLGPPAGPVVLPAVEGRGAHPVLEGEFVGVAHAEPALLRGVHQEQPAEGPVRLTSQGSLGFLVEEHHAATGIGQFRGGDQACQARAHHDHISVGGIPAVFAQRGHVVTAPLP